MLFLAALAVAASAVTTADFFSFGTSAGDTRKTGGNNGCAATVNMRTEPVFYGGQASRNAKISRDGQILFGFCNGAGIASSFPQYSKEGIAVYHADHDYRGSGDINQALYYRETNSDASEFQSRLSALGLGDFLPTSVLIVTWDGVGYRNKKADLGVTYQAAIGTDGTDSWAIFYYADMQWKESQGAKPAFGFQNRAGDEFFQLDEATVQNIENESNVGVPGVFVYKISDPSSVAVIGDPVVVDFAGHKFAAGRQPSTWSTLLQTENGEEIRMRTMAIQGGHHDYFLDTIEFVRPGCEGTMTVQQRVRGHGQHAHRDGVLRRAGVAQRQDFARRADSVWVLPRARDRVVVPAVLQGRHCRVPRRPRLPRLGRH